MSFFSHIFQSFSLLTCKNLQSFKLAYMNEKRSLFIMVFFENSLESFFLEKIEFENLEMKYPIQIQKSKNPESYHYVEQFIIFNNTFVSLKTFYADHWNEISKDARRRMFTCFEGKSYSQRAFSRQPCDVTRQWRKIYLGRVNVYYNTRPLINNFCLFSRP